MANPHKGEVSIEAGGKSYTLSYSINALCVLEDTLGKGVAEIAQGMQDPAKMRLSTARAVFWAGLTDHHPEIETQEQAGEILRVMGAGEGIMAMGKAFELAFPKVKANGARPTRAQAGRGVKPAGTGKASATDGSRAD